MLISKKNFALILLGFIVGCAQVSNPKVSKGVVSPSVFSISNEIAEEKTDENDDKESALSTAEYYFGLGEYAYNEGHYKDAYEFYLNASFFDNKSLLIKDKLTLTIYRIIYSNRDFFSRWEKLRSSYFLILNKNSSLDFLSGIFNFLDGNYRISARYLLNEVVENGNSSKPLFSFLLFTLHKAKMLEQELAVAQMAHKKYPDNPKFANWYAYAIIINDKIEYFDFAATLLESCLKQEPENIYYWDSMMWLYYKWGKQKFAYSVAEEKLSGEDVLSESEIVLHLGYVYLGQNMLAEAGRYFNLVVKLDKGDFAAEAAEQLKIMQAKEVK